jgi:NTE family protein
MSSPGLSSPYGSSSSSSSPYTSSSSSSSSSSSYTSSSSSSSSSSSYTTSSFSGASIAHASSNRSPSQEDIEKKQRALENITELFQLKTKSAEKKPSENKCFKAVYQACSDRNWVKVESQRDSISLLINKQGRSLLQEAILRGDVDLAEAMIGKEIAVHTVDPEGNKPVHYIAGQFNDLRLLDPISFHNSRDVRNYDGVTPMHRAAERGHNQIIQSLILGGANLHGVAKYNIGGQIFSFTPLAIATIKGHYETIDLLLTENKKNPALKLNLSFGSHGSLLHLLIAFEHVEILDRLLRDHYDQLSKLLEEPNLEGMNPFLFAASRGNQDALLVLKNRNVNINATAPDRKSAYHFAAISRARGTLTLLARMGCDGLTSGDAENNRPIDYVRNSQDSASQSTQAVLEGLERLGDKLKDATPSFDITPLENLAFKGGGPKGIAYVGVIEELERRGKMGEVKRVSGTSAGAITATLIGFGYDGKGTKKILKETSLISFLDHPFTLENLGQKIKSHLFRLLNPVNWVKDPLRALWHTTGLCKGDIFLHWMEDRIKEGLRKHGIEKDNCTFGELRAMIDKQNLPFRHIHVFTTNIAGKEEIVCLSSEDPRYDNVIIAHAIRASMSIPIVFEPHILHVKSVDGRVDPAPSLGRFVDGGMLYNFPLEAFDKRKFQTNTPLSIDAGEAPIVNRRTLGFNLFSPAEEPNVGIPEIKTIKDLLGGIMKAYFHAEDLRRNLVPYNEKRIVDIDNTGVGTLDFNLSEERQNALIESGKRATRNFLSAQEELGLRHGMHILKAVVNIPGTGTVQLRQKHPDFVGREILLKQLRTTLVRVTSSSSSLPVISSSSSSSSSSSPSATSSVAVLWGAKGVGKTEIAIAFANDHSTHFSTIGWIYAANEHSRDQSYRRLAEKIGVDIGHNTTSVEVENAVHSYLKNEHPNPYLLVFDGAEPGINIPRDGHGSILITTVEEYSFEGEFRQPVRNFTPDEVTQLLAKTGEENPENIRRLAELLNNNPMHLNQALRYLQNDSKMVIPAYIERLEQEQITPFQVLVNRLIEREPEALGWLKVCSNLQSDGIPSDWLESWLTIESPESNDVERTLKKGRIQRILTDLGLLRYDESTKSFSLTGSIQEETMRVAGVERNAVIANTLALIASQGKVLNTNPADNLQGYGKWVLHADAILKVVESNPRNLHEASIRAQLGRWNLYRKSHAEAKQLLEASLRSYTTVFGEQARSESASILSELGTVELSLNNPQDSVEYFRRASVQWGEVNHGRDAVESAKALNHLGSILHTLNQNEEAKIPLQSALAMLRRLSPGLNRPEIATCALNLGLAHFSLREFQDAQLRLTEALTMWRAIHNINQNTQEIVTCLTKLGSMSFDSAQVDEHYEAAETQLTEALQRQKIIFGGDRPETIDLLMLLGKTFARRSKHEDAKTHFQQALNMAKRLYGERDRRVKDLEDEAKRFREWSCVIA